MRLSMVTLDIGNRTGANARLLRQLLLREKLSSAELSQPTFIGEKGIGYGDARYGDMFVINADGTSLTQLTNNAPVGENIAVSPDSKQIAFVISTCVSPSGGHPYPPDDIDMYIVNVDGTGLTRLTNTETQEGILTWVWK